MNCFEDFFIVFLEVTYNKFIGTIKMFGNVRNAAKYTYKFILRKEQVFSWKSSPSNMNQEHEDLIAEGNCLIMDEATMLHFKDGNNSIIIKIEIKKM